MKIGKIIWAGAIAMALSSASQAAPLYYDCDTPANKFSEVKLPIEAAGLTIIGKITPLEFRKGEYLPVANIRVESGDEKNSVAIRLIAQDYKSVDADIILRSVSDGKTVEGMIGKVKRSENVQFIIKSVSPARITLTINGRVIGADVAVGDKPSLSMTCSTGQFQFTDVEWTNK